MIGTYVAPLEVKFADDALGEFYGLASAHGVVDSHGDVVVPGAFSASLAEHKARGSMPTMYVQHGPALGGDPLPVGVWTHMEEDAHGLRVKGRISALDTDYGRRIRSLVRDGALKGLSIGYNVATNGAVYGRKAGEPRRTLKAVRLVEVSLVSTPSNDRAWVESIKSRLDSDDPCHPMARADNFKATDSEVRTAIRWLRAAIALHERHMSGDAPTTGAAGRRSQQEMMDQMRNALAALTDDAEPSRMSGMKALPQFREFRDLLREQWDFSRSQAEHIAEFGYKSLIARESAEGEAMTDEAKAALDDIRATARAFSLPSF